MLRFSHIGAALALTGAIIAPTAAQERPAKDIGTMQKPRYPFTGFFPTADARAAALIDVLRRPLPQAGRVDGDDYELAFNCLVAMGKTALPKLLDAVAEPKQDVAYRCTTILIEIGKSAVEEVRTRWPKYDDTMRWRLMEFRGRHDYDKAADYAIDCLKNKDDNIRAEAWAFLLKHKEKRVKDDFFRELRGTSDSPCMCVITNEPVFDADKEVELLIALLVPDSWAALDKGIPNRPRKFRHVPNDERYFVIEALSKRNSKRAAPDLLKMLAEKGPGRAYFAGQIVPILGTFGYKDAVPELKRILEADEKLFTFPGVAFPRSWIKMLTARAFWQLGDPKGREYLTPFLAKNHSWGDRQFVAEAYARYGEKSDIPFLTGLLDDSDSSVLEFVCKGLKRITAVDVVTLYKDTPVSGGTHAPLWKEWYKKEYGKKP